MSSLDRRQFLKLGAAAAAVGTFKELSSRFLISEAKAQTLDWSRAQPMYTPEFENFFYEKEVSQDDRIYMLDVIQSQLRSDPLWSSLDMDTFQRRLVLSGQTIVVDVTSSKGFGIENLIPEKLLGEAKFLIFGIQIGDDATQSMTFITCPTKLGRGELFAASTNGRVLETQKRRIYFRFHGRNLDNLDRLDFEQANKFFNGILLQLSATN